MTPRKRPWPPDAELRAWTFEQLEGFSVLRLWTPTEQLPQKRRVGRPYKPPKHLRNPGTVREEEIAMALQLVSEIRALWQQEFGRKKRARGELSAEQVAAEMVSRDITADDVLAAMKPSGKN